MLCMLLLMLSVSAQKLYSFKVKSSFGHVRGS